MHCKLENWQVNNVTLGIFSIRTSTSTKEKKKNRINKLSRRKLDNYSFEEGIVLRNFGTWKKGLDLQIVQELFFSSAYSSRTNAITLVRFVT